MWNRMILRWILAAGLCLYLVPAALAASPQEEAAAARLREQGVLVGGETGELHLEQELSRAELAVLLTRLHGQGEEDPQFYTWACYHEDVPDWARGYVGYCTAMRLMSGYGGLWFGAEDPVTAEAACTVVLRLFGWSAGEGRDWSHQTAVAYAQSLGLLSQGEITGTVTRGEMALLLDRAANWDPHTVSDGYVIQEDHWSREDFSRQANPAVFTPVYDRALYNAIRQTLVDGTGPDAPGDQFAYTMVEDERYSEVKWILGRLSGVTRYEHHVPTTLKNYYEYLDYFAVVVERPEVYQDAIAFIQPILQEAGQLPTDREKVAFLNDYLKGLLTYERGATSGIPQTFSPHSGELPAACGSYAYAFSFLCTAAGIPCFDISSDVHSWNLVYVDGDWLHVDVSANDLGFYDTILMTETVTGQNHTDAAPDATEFLKELLAPGSTK